MNGLPAWWMALAEQARAGLAQGSGPWWSERFLCGQPLFGAPELPFGGPPAALLLGLGVAGPACWLGLHALLLSAGLALWLRHDGASLGIDRRSAGLAAFLAVAAGLVHPEAAVLLGVWAWLPWVLLLAGRVPVFAAAPFCALLACAGSPLTLLLGLLGSGKAAGWKRSWALAWGLGALLAAPALLETLRLAPGAGSVVLPGWQFGWLGSPLLCLQAGLAAFALLLLLSGWMKGREILALGLTAAALALAGPLFHSTGLKALPEHHYVSDWTRHQAGPGALPDAAADLEVERWTGAQGGLAPKASLLRWRLLSALGTRDPDSLSLANVGWLDNNAPQAWQQPVSTAVVDGAEGPNASAGLESGLFQRPLRLATVDPGPGRGQSWHLFTPRPLAPGLWQVDLVHSPGQGSWAFISESFDRGWNAEVLAPGQALPRVLAASQGGFTAAALQGGEGVLQWRYRPPSLGLGLILALLGCFAWVGAAWGQTTIFGR